MSGGLIHTADGWRALRRLTPEEIEIRRRLPPDAQRDQVEAGVAAISATADSVFAAWLARRA